MFIRRDIFFLIVLWYFNNAVLTTYVTGQQCPTRYIIISGKTQYETIMGYFKVFFYAVFSEQTGEIR
jgi:hypothetical protein